MQTLRNLIDVLQAHGTRLPHMMDKSMSVQVGDETHALSSCLVSPGADGSVLCVGLPVAEPAKAETKPVGRVLETLRGPIEIKE